MSKRTTYHSLKPYTFGNRIIYAISLNDAKKRLNKNVKDEEQRVCDYYQSIREADRESDWQEAPVQPITTEDDLPF